MQQLDYARFIRIALPSRNLVKLKLYLQYIFKGISRDCLTEKELFALHCKCPSLSSFENLIVKTLEIVSPAILRLVLTCEKDVISSCNPLALNLIQVIVATGLLTTLHLIVYLELTAVSTSVFERLISEIGTENRQVDNTYYTFNCIFFLLLYLSKLVCLLGQFLFINISRIMKFNTYDMIPYQSHYNSLCMRIASANNYPGFNMWPIDTEINL